MSQTTSSNSSTSMNSQRLRCVPWYVPAAAKLPPSHGCFLLPASPFLLPGRCRARSPVHGSSRRTAARKSRRRRRLEASRSRDSGLVWVGTSIILASRSKTRHLHCVIPRLDVLLQDHSTISSHSIIVLIATSALDLPTNQIYGSRRGSTLDAERFLQRRDHFSAAPSAIDRSHACDVTEAGENVGMLGFAGKSTIGIVTVSNCPWHRIGSLGFERGQAPLEERSSGFTDDAFDAKLELMTGLGRDVGLP